MLSTGHPPRLSSPLTGTATFTTTTVTFTPAANVAGVSLSYNLSEGYGALPPPHRWSRSTCRRTAANSDSPQWRQRRPSRVEHWIAKRQDCRPAEGNRPFCNGEGRDGYSWARTTVPAGVQRRNMSATSALITFVHAAESSPHSRAACAGVNRSPGISRNSLRIRSSNRRGAIGAPCCASRRRWRPARRPGRNALVPGGVRLQPEVSKMSATYGVRQRCGFPEVSRATRRVAAHERRRGTRQQTNMSRSEVPERASTSEDIRNVTRAGGRASPHRPGRVWFWTVTVDDIVRRSPTARCLLEQAASWWAGYPLT